MSGEINLSGELKKLQAMPYFLHRFIALSLVFTFNDFARTFVKTSFFVPLLGLLLCSAIYFAIFEVLTLVKIKPYPSLTFAKLPLAIWLAFGIVSLIAEIFNGFVMNSIWMLLVLPLFLLMGQEKMFFNLFLFSCGTPIICNIIAGIICYPLTDNNYSLSLAALIPVLLCAVAWILLNPRKFYVKAFLLFAALAAILLYLSGVSGGRTGFLTIIATIVLFVIALIVKFYSAKKSILYKNGTITFTIILSVILMISLTVAGAIVIDSLNEAPENPESIENLSGWDKFVTSFNNGNPLSNRGTIWKYTLSNIKLFGNGHDFYKTPLLTPDQNSAHNSYLAVLGHFGLISFALFVVFCVMMLILSVRYALASRLLYIFPFTVLTSFFIGSITEDLFYMFSPRTFTLLFFAASAFLIITDCEKKEKTGVTEAKM